MNEATTTVTLTEREMEVIVIALETQKREDFRNGYREAVEEVVALRNKMRDA